MKTINTSSFKETQQLGFDFAKNLKGGEVLALYGDLGSGKTTFVQGLAKGLGIEKSIISPTFIIMRTYDINVKSQKSKVKSTTQKSKVFYHVDLYRISSESDVESLGLLELMGDPENIIAIEWPDKIENVLPDKRVNIYFEYLGDERREIRFNF